MIILDRSNPLIDKCDLCGVHDELRPYGPNGENVCFDCGMKNKDACEKALDKEISQQEKLNKLEELNDNQRTDKTDSK